MPVFINNVDDYLGPSQACVNPLFAAPSQPTHSVDVNIKFPQDAAFLSDSANNSVSKSEITPSVIQGRRRNRQRRAPQIIQSEDTNLISTQDATIRIATDDDTVIQDSQLTSSTIATITTQTIKKKAKATVTLSDCLSCSGCITSAEAVLMSHHSIDNLREVVRSRYQTQKKIVFTISSASLSDIYRHLYLELEKDDDSNEVESIVNRQKSQNTRSESDTPSRQEFLSMISSFLYSELSAEIVIDGYLAQKVSLEESAAEFCYRYKHSRQRQSDPCSAQNLLPVVPSIALSSTKTRYIKQQTESNGDGITDADSIMEMTTVTHSPGRSLEEDTNVEPISVTNTSFLSNQSSSLPMLSSSCPGFVCLVEKTAPLVVPLLSSAKSPMSIAGTLLKSGHVNSRVSFDHHHNDEMSGNTIQDTGSWYHVAIMPCHDKKLEAGRNDFAWERQTLLKYGRGVAKVTEKSMTEEYEDELVHEVDLVLTTGELLEVLIDAAAKLTQMNPPSLPVSLPSTSDVLNELKIRAVRDMLARTTLPQELKPTTKTSSSAGDKPNHDIELDTGVHGSGSYADFIFRYAAQELFDCKLSPDQPLPWKSSYSSSTVSTSTVGLVRRRSRRQETTDLREVTLYEKSDGSYSCFLDENGDNNHSYRPVLRFATAYGFKNVQLMLQRLSKVESSNVYDYVEVMACPSGCSNGGGQIGANGHHETPRATKDRVRKTVSSIPIVRPNSNQECGSYASRFCDCDCQNIFHESFLERKCFDRISQELLHTQFHVVPKLELTTGATAGVALSETKW